VFAGPDLGISLWPRHRGPGPHLADDAAGDRQVDPRLLGNPTRRGRVLADHHTGLELPAQLEANPAEGQAGKADLPPGHPRHPGPSQPLPRRLAASDPRRQPSGSRRTERPASRWPPGHGRSFALLTPGPGRGRLFRRGRSGRAGGRLPLRSPRPPLLPPLLPGWPAPARQARSPASISCRGQRGYGPPEIPQWLGIKGASCSAKRRLTWAAAPGGWPHAARPAKLSFPWSAFSSPSVSLVSFQLRPRECPRCCRWRTIGREIACFLPVFRGGVRVRSPGVFPRGRPTCFANILRGE
jgi:hypothetical protein